MVKFCASNQVIVFFWIWFGYALQIWVMYERNKISFSGNINIKARHCYTQKWNMNLYFEIYLYLPSKQD
jgi:hypothetical protein